MMKRSRASASSSSVKRPTPLMAMRTARPSGTPALIVPAAAVKRFGGRKLVQVVGPDGRRRDVEVETGITTDADVEVTDGLTEGQAVVAS